ncbi:S8 family serine peptidase [Paenibacillus sp. FSL R5-0475]|uniref:S8 family peptidase n=1 Tax=Paenibacillus sp. FSL R5-0475 TaxID=2921643 RepID=UPI0030FBBD94
MVLIIFTVFFCLAFSSFKHSSDIHYQIVSPKEASVINFDKKQQVPWGVLYQNQKISYTLTNKFSKVIKVAIMDSGIDEQHEDLENTSIIQYNAVDLEEPVFDKLGHGTAIAGIIAANDNEFGLVGVSPHVKILSIKVLNDEGKGEIESFVRGIEWAIDHDADIINMSFGIKRDDPQLKTAIEKALKHGVIVVAAVGNKMGSEAEFPAAYKEVISITGIDSTENIFSLASRGKVDFSAPGKDILSLSPNDQYAVYNGTSFATAHITGTIANLLLINDYSKNENINTFIKNDLTSLSKDLGNKGYDNIYGNGSLSN